MLNIAHRGASGSRPENTVEAFSHGLAIGADGVELDVRRCRSGELVVIHDATLKRTAVGSGRISAKRLDELKTYRLKGGGQIPALEEVFHALGKQAYCFIELKTPEAAHEVAQLIADYTAKGWSRDRLILIAFRHSALKSARKTCSSLCIGASFKRLSILSVARAKRLKAEYIIPHYKSVTPGLVKLAHTAGLKVVVWTVNAPRDIKRMRACGVDGIMTDYPDRIAPEA